MNGPLLAARGVVVERLGRRVLENASLSLCAGERVGLTGANGAGKTTLLHTLIGLERPVAGEIVAFGSPRRKESDFHPVRLRIGFLFQDPDDQLFCATVLEDVAFGPLNQGLDGAAAEARARLALARLGLAALADRPICRLSGGEKRFVAIAGLFAMRPDVLLLDEPTNDLDEANRSLLIDLLATLPMAMVLASHDRALLDRLATRTVVLANGRIAAAELTGHPADAPPPAARGGSPSSSPAPTP